jgi:hypothetical protein
MSRHLERYLAFKVHGRILKTRRSPRRRLNKGPARDWRYKGWIRTLPCLVCQSEPSEAAHTGCDGGMKLKASDYSCVPLCTECHTMRPDSYHRLGREDFERRHELHLAQTVMFLNLEWRERKWR